MGASGWGGLGARSHAGGGDRSPGAASAVTVWACALAARARCPLLLRLTVSLGLGGGVGGLGFSGRCPFRLCGRGGGGEV